jgi:hypothetical protein
MPISVYPPFAATVQAVGAQSSVPASTITTLATMTANGSRYVTRVSVSGQEYAKYTLHINTILKETWRSGPDRSIIFEWGNPLGLESGDVLDVKVEHFVTGQTPDFAATVYGY